MTKNRALGAALVLLLIAFPLISLGTTRAQPVLWWAGLALLVLGGLIPPVTRYVLENGEEEG